MMRMNVKQKLIAIATAFREIRSRIYYRFSCFQGHCPTSDEIENRKIKSLASRLKAESYEETLTNILEWQNKNIEFWTERHPISTLLMYIYLIFVVAVVIFFYGFLISILLLIMLNIQIVTWFTQTAWWFIILSIVILASSTITILATMIFILHSNRKIPWKEVPRGLKNVFWPSISMKWLLENKLGVCRDYAKLTACLLSNIYPNAKIYFAHAPGHVATGTSIDNKLYMLDQRLPILTIEKWNDYRKPRKSDKIERFDPIKKTLSKVDKKTFLQTKNKSELDTEKLAKKMMELLNIKEQLDDKAVSLKVPIPWKKGVKQYEDNEMVNYSLARRLKMEISNELIRINHITRIEIDRHKDDLIFLIRFSLD
jgi:predicted transglutaminase-like protease